MKRIIAIFVATAMLLMGCGQLGAESETTKPGTEGQRSDFSGKNVSEINIIETGGEDGRDNEWIISQNDGRNIVVLTDRMRKTVTYNISDEDFQTLTHTDFSDYVGVKADTENIIDAVYYNIEIIYEDGTKDEAEVYVPALWNKLYEIIDAYEPVGVYGTDALTENNQEQQTEIYGYYEELIDAARECIIKDDGEEPVDYDFSYVIYVYGDDENGHFGYLIKDIDGNGTEELIFGENVDTRNSPADGVIYDIYTISDGELVHVLSGGERNRYYFCENGMIANEGSGGAAYSVYAYYNFEGTGLHLVEMVIYDGWKDENNPWFYSTQSQDDVENEEPISDEQAQTIIENYVYEHPVFIPFVKDH